MVEALAPPLQENGGANKSNVIRKRRPLFECSAKKRKGAYLLIGKKFFFLFALTEEVSHDISFFVF
jgi:hypothetical protein